MRKSSQVLMGALSLVSVAVGLELGATAKPSGIFTPTPTPTPNPTDPSGTPTPTPTSPTPTKPPATISHQSNAVKYRYGTVQLTVTKTGTAITNINLDQAGATNGRGTSFPYLVSLTLNAQNSTFDTSMLTGATFSVNAYKQALTNALGQF